MKESKMNIFILVIRGVLSQKGVFMMKDNGDTYRQILLKTVG